MMRFVATTTVMIMGLAAVGSGIYFLRRLHGMARASGTIADFERHFMGETDANFPVVSFQGPDSHEIRAMVPQGRIFSRPKVGMHVRVFYDPTNSADVLIGSAGVRFGGIIYIVLGLGLLTLVAVSVLLFGQ